MSASASSGYKEYPSQLEYSLTETRESLVGTLKSVLEDSNYTLHQGIMCGLENLITLLFETDWNRAPPSQNLVALTTCSRSWAEPLFADIKTPRDTDSQLRFPPVFINRLKVLEDNIPYEGNVRHEAIRHVFLFTLYFFSEKPEEGVFDHIH